MEYWNQPSLKMMGVDTQYLSPANINHKENNILLPARMLYEKGVYEFIEAARILKKRNVEGNFYLAGDNISVNPSRISNEKINTTTDASAAYKKQEGSYFDTYFKYGLTYDKRNYKFQPTDGFVSNWIIF